MIDRRTTIQLMMAVAAMWPEPEWETANVQFGGYGVDPNLVHSYHPGEIWPLALSDAQRQTAAALCDVIIPADDKSVSASAAGVVDFIAEWVSAPYPLQRADRRLILDGFGWLDEQARTDFRLRFSRLTLAQQHSICDRICNERQAELADVPAARFFARYRDLTAGGFYSTIHGRRDVQYIGNVPLATFDGPPVKLLQKLGLVDAQGSHLP